VMSIPGLFAPEVLMSYVLYRDYAAMTGATLFLASAIYLGRLRKAAPTSHSYMGRSVGMLLVTFYGMYYYFLYISI
jgi:cation:H+ antiporter